MKNLFKILFLSIFVFSCDEDYITEDDVDDQVLNLSFILLQETDSSNKHFICYNKDYTLNSTNVYDYTIINYDNYFDDGTGCYVNLNYIYNGFSIYVSDSNNQIIKSFLFENDNEVECSTGLDGLCHIVDTIDETGEYNTSYNTLGFIGSDEGCYEPVGLELHDSQNTLKINYQENFLYHHGSEGGPMSILDLSHYEILYFQELITN